MDAATDGTRARGAGIEVRGLVVTRGGRRVLHGLDCDVEAGRVTGLLGPSGSGKTTLLRCIVGTQRIQDGGVSVLGLPGGSAELRRRVGYVTQAPSVYSDLSVEANARYFAALYGISSQRVGAALGAVGLHDERRRLVGRLSSGQRARASLACALLVEPEVLVLDEPTVGLDPVLRRELWRLFAALARDGATVLVSTHVMDEADRCDHLLLLREGRLLASDSPATLLQRTAAADLDTAFVRLIEEGVAA